MNLPLRSPIGTWVALAAVVACNGDQPPPDGEGPDSITLDADTTFGFIASLPPCGGIPDRIKSPPPVTISVAADTIALDKQPVLVCAPGNPMLQWQRDAATVDSFFIVFPDSTPMASGQDTVRPPNPNAVAGGPVDKLGWFKYDVHVWPTGEDSALVRDPDSVIIPGGR